MKQFLKRIYKSICSFLNRHLPIQIKPNAIYTRKDIIKPIIRASVENTTIESSARRLKNISADDVFYHLNKLSYRQINLCLDRGIEESFIKAKKKHRLTKATIAIDITDIPYYGKDNGVWVHNTKDGKVLKFITAHIVTRGYRFTLFAIPVSVFYIKHQLVNQLINIAKQHIKIDCVLLDRAFESIDVINRLKGLNVKFIMPKKRNKRTVKILKYCYLNNIPRIKHMIKSDNKYADFDLVVYETEADIVGFVTNMKGKPEHIAHLYTKRWGIETGYKMKNIFYARTCSRSFGIRFLLILLSFMLYNFWVLGNKMLEFKGLHITAGDMCLYFVRFMESGIP